MQPFRIGPLTAENLTKAAPELKIMVTVDVNGVRPVQPQEVANMVLGPGPVGLPQRVDDFLLRARECMAYGGFHYPFITIGMVQFYGRS